MASIAASLHGSKRPSVSSNPSHARARSVNVSPDTRRVSPRAALSADTSLVGTNRLQRCSSPYRRERATVSKLGVPPTAITSAVVPIAGKRSVMTSTISSPTTTCSRSPPCSTRSRRSSPMPSTRSSWTRSTSRSRSRRSSGSLALAAALDPFVEVAGLAEPVPALVALAAMHAPRVVVATMLATTVAIRDRWAARRRAAVGTEGFVMAVIVGDRRKTPPSAA